MKIEHQAPARVKRAWIEATITRADGTVEHLGTVAETVFPDRRRTLIQRIGDWLCKS